MHRSLKFLKIKSDKKDLQDRSRLMRLYFEKSFYSICVALFFLVAVGVLLKFIIGTASTSSLSSLNYKTQFKQWAVSVFFTFAFVSVFVAAAIGFLWRPFTDPILKWLISPQSCKFVEGAIVKAEYVPSGQGRRQLDRMRAVVKIKDQPVTFVEDFACETWQFTTEKEDELLRPGDAYYDMKAAHKALPVHGYILMTNSKFMRPILVALIIPEKVIVKKTDQAQNQSPHSSKAI